MRWATLATAFLILNALPATASAGKEPRYSYGWGEEVVIIGDLPAQFRAEARDALGVEPKVAFLYWRFFVLGEDFDLWTSNGRFVLYHQHQYWEYPRKDLEELLGPDEAKKLTVPWKYRVPRGLALVVMVITAIVLFSKWKQRSAKQLRSLMRDERYLAAMKEYAEQLPDDSVPTKDQIQTAIAFGVNRLVDQGIRAKQAETQLRVLIGSIEMERSDALRDEAIKLFEQGEWEAASVGFKQAAEIAEEWNPNAVGFLKKQFQECNRRKEREQVNPEISE